MEIHASLDIDPTDLHAAAVAQNMTDAQFIAWAVNNAVETHKRREELLQALHSLVQGNI